MLRVLKNYVRETIRNNFRGRIKEFRSKASRIFDMEDEEQRAEYYFWKTTYDFIQDITIHFPKLNKGGDKT